MDGGINRLVIEREKSRQEKDFSKADELRKKIEFLGFTVKDTPRGPILSKKPQIYYSKSSEVPSNLEAADRFKFSFSVVSNTTKEELTRLIDSIRNYYYDAYRSLNGLEILVTENSLDNRTREYLTALARADLCVRFFLSGEKLGEASARNITLRQALGKYIVVCDTSTEITGDIFNPLSEILSKKKVGLVGPFGLVSEDLHSFRELLRSDHDTTLEVAAQQLYFMAFHRQLLRETGFFNEKFKFYRHLDLDFSFSVKDKGYKIIDLPLPVEKHPHSVWESLTDEEKDKKSRKNFYIFLDRWHSRTDLLC